MTSSSAQSHNDGLNLVHLERAAVILFILPFMNGFYNRALRSHPAIFWAVDVFQFIILPAAIAVFLFTRSGLTARDIGLGGHSTGPERKRLLIHCLVVGLLFYPTYMLLREVFITILPISRYPAAFDYGAMLPSTPAGRWLSSAYYAIGGGISEEFYYRGILVALFLEYRMGKAMIVLVVSSIFALVHWESGLFNIPTVFFLSVLLTAYYVRFRMLAPLIVGHFVTDLIFFAKGF